MASAPPMRLDEGELRAITGWAAQCARRALDLFEADQLGDARPREAIEAALAASAAAGAAYLHPLAAATQVHHVLDAAVHHARAFELAGGDDHDVGDAHLRRAADQAPTAVADVLRRMPPAPTGRTRRAQMLTSLEAALRR